MDVIGVMQLFTAAGPDLVRRIIANGGRIFLDLKYHDIPNTVRLAGIEATRLGVSIFNIHVPGPGQRFDDDAVDAEYFVLSIAGVVIIQPHRLRGGAY